MGRHECVVQACVCLGLMSTEIGIIQLVGEPVGVSLSKEINGLPTSGFQTSQKRPTLVRSPAVAA